MAQNVNFREIVAFIRERAASEEYREFMVNLLCDLIDIDNTTTDRSLPDIVANEKKTFDLLEKSLRKFAGNDITFERTPIDPAIEAHPYYTKAYYTANDEYPLGQPAAASYKDRCNLLAMVNPNLTSEKGKPVLLNAHVDTVSPFYPSRVDDKCVHGRGACDDKGPVVGLAACMKLLGEVQQKFGEIPMKPYVYQFVIEEEPGGNGSLSAALDKRFQGYEAIIGEATKDIPFPANRGAMWFQLDMTTNDGTNLAEVMPFVIRELAREGQTLRQETNQPLFPKEYVQVNLGTLNGFGRHPSAVNDYVAYDVTVNNTQIDQLRKLIESALPSYGQAYVDRTAEVDAETNQPKLKQHYALSEVSADENETRFKLEIFGVGGHMGAMLLCDNALIKTGYILQSLIQGGLDAEFSLAEENFDPATMVLSGGVGFTPTHKMEDLKERLMAAVRCGIKKYNEAVGASVLDDVARMSFDKLHNEAYASPLDCPAMKAFRKAYDELSLAWPEPIAWRASCDARIYANTGYNTITFGPGDLADAHSDHEKITLDNLRSGLEVLAITTLALLTGEYEQ